jgi:hypothetical protein
MEGARVNAGGCVTYHRLCTPADGDPILMRDLQLFFFGGKQRVRICNCGPAIKKCTVQRELPYLCRRPYGILQRAPSDECLRITVTAARMFR